MPPLPQVPNSHNLLLELFCGLSGVQVSWPSLATQERRGGQLRGTRFWARGTFLTWRARPCPALPRAPPGSLVLTSQRFSLTPHPSFPMFRPEGKILLLLLLISLETRAALLAACFLNEIDAVSPLEPQIGAWTKGGETRPPRPLPFQNPSLISPLPRAPAAAWVFVLFLKKTDNPVPSLWASPRPLVNRPRHRSVFLGTLFLPPDVRPPYERAGCLSAPARALRLLRPGRGRGRGWVGGAPGRFRFLRRGPPLPRLPQDCVSVHNIYMYVLFPVLYGPCPLSGRPHKSSPQSLAAWCFDSRGRAGEGERQRCQSESSGSPPSSATSDPEDLFIQKARVSANSLSATVPPSAPKPFYLFFLGRAGVSRAS